MPNQKGFTIIELIVVIAIIAVLAGIVLVNVTQYTTKSKVAGIKEAMREYQKAQVQYYDENGLYSNCMAPPDPCFSIGLQIQDNLGGFPYDASTDAGQKYCLSASLPDGSDWCVDNTGYVGPDKTKCNNDSPSTASCQ